MASERCTKPIGCGRYLDGLTDGAEAHPIYDTLCVACGAKFFKEWGWSKAQHSMIAHPTFPPCTNCGIQDGYNMRHSLSGACFRCGNIAAHSRPAAPQGGEPEAAFAAYTLLVSHLHPRLQTADANRLRAAADRVYVALASPPAGAPPTCKYGYQQWAHEDEPIACSCGFFRGVTETASLDSKDYQCPGCHGYFDARDVRAALASRLTEAPPTQSRDSK